MSLNLNEMERNACRPPAVLLDHFNQNAKIPYGVGIKHICAAMNDFVAFVELINQRLHENGDRRIESIIMPANFSSIVGEFASSTIPKHCKSIVKNQYHNGHPDLIPANRYPANSVLHADEGIEVKGSRYLTGWQGHNPEKVWLMVFVFDSNRPVDDSEGIEPKPFRFLRVLGAPLLQQDWSYSGRSGGSRRTITATVKKSGYEKMKNNWIYLAPDQSL